VNISPEPERQNYLTAEEAGDSVGAPKDEVDAWCERKGAEHGVLCLTGAFMVPVAALRALRVWVTTGRPD
jgi:hypothetical protein